MGFQSIKRILPTAIQKSGIAKQVTAVRVVEEASRVLVAFWGEERAAFVHVVSFKDGTLSIHSGSSVATQELQVWRARLQNEINRRLEAKTVQTITIRFT